MLFRFFPFLFLSLLALPRRGRRARAPRPCLASKGHAQHAAEEALRRLHAIGGGEVGTLSERAAGGLERAHGDD